MLPLGQELFFLSVLTSWRGGHHCYFFCPFWVWLLLWECPETGMVVVMGRGRTKPWAEGKRIS